MIGPENYLGSYEAVSAFVQCNSDSEGDEKPHSVTYEYLTASPSNSIKIFGQTAFTKVDAANSYQNWPSQEPSC